MMRKISPASQAGLTLVELLIAMTLGIILTYGVTEIYINSKQTYRSQDGLARMQESARFALDFIARDIRSSGYVGCSNIKTITPSVVTTTPSIAAYSLTNVLNGHHNLGSQSWTPSLPTGVNSVVDDTDVITATGGGQCSTPLTADMAAVSDGLSMATANECGFSQNDVAIVANCSSADIFRITNAPGSSGQLSHADLAVAYTTSAASEVLTYSSNTYFIRNDATSGLPSLFVLDNTQNAGGSNPIALIEGVENMQIQYGIDTNADNVPEIYANASGTINWSQVVSTRITLLMRSIEETNAPSYTFTAGGTTKTYAAGPMRKEFVSTVQIRNRGL
ncbi:MAG: PilW family protein [Cellvibrionaceae bacterium]